MHDHGYRWTNKQTKRCAHRAKTSDAICFFVKSRVECIASICIVIILLSRFDAVRPVAVFFLLFDGVRAKVFFI